MLLEALVIWITSPLVPPHDLGYLPPEEVVIIATGSQGEPRAALQRLAQRRHPFVDLEPGGSVIFPPKQFQAMSALSSSLKTFTATRCHAVRRNEPPRASCNRPPRSGRAEKALPVGEAQNATAGTW